MTKTPTAPAANPIDMNAHACHGDGPDLDLGCVACVADHAVTLVEEGEFASVKEATDAIMASS